MKNIAARALLFGAIAAAGFLGLSYGLALVASKVSAPSAFSWPVVAFLAGGIPLAWLLEQTPGLSLAWLPNPGDGPVGPAVSKLFFAACLTWPVVIAACRYLVLRRRRPAPNNSSKPTPLRGAA